VDKQEIELKVYRGRLKKAHDRFPEKITPEMLEEFELDVASGEQERKTIAAGRAERWLDNLE
jgi:hypothetical protein